IVILSESSQEKNVSDIDIIKPSQSDTIESFDIKESIIMAYNGQGYHGVTSCSHNQEIDPAFTKAVMEILRDDPSLSQQLAIFNITH
ncbi:MAG: hypothetical protein K0R12_102, partial [Gammaproteobacteria bacterium]|nr:hypothetical protein [Gammaproteobacteria bacterium]